MGATYTPVQKGPEDNSLLYNAYRVSVPEVSWPERGVDYPPESVRHLCHNCLLEGEIYLKL